MADPAAPSAPGAPPLPSGEAQVRRHRLSARLWHWTNAVAVIIMLMSGLMIFNAHPRLYWGEYGANPDYAWLEIGNSGASGWLRVGSVTVPTSGLLGTFTDAGGIVQTHAFPGWLTIPSGYSLADARLWHLAFAWLLALGLLVYLLVSLVNGHLRQDLHVTRAEWRPAHLWHDVKDHARLRFAVGTAALRYGVLQKLAYCGVIFGLLPLAIFSGMAMSPGLNAGLPFLTDLLGGRQSARSLHFLAALGMAAFIAVHLAMVLLSGPVNGVRAMITGWYRLPAARGDD